MGESVVLPCRCQARRRTSGAGLSGTVEASGNEQLHYSRLNKG